MKILSYKLDGYTLIVTTDNPSRPDFVYPIGKFLSVATLTAEIERSIAREAARTTKQVAGTAPVLRALDGEVAKNAG